MKKTLYFDLETTGVDSKLHSIIQFAAIVEYDDEIVDKVNISFQPFDDAEIEADALAKQNLTIEDILEYQDHHAGFLAVKGFLDKHINKFDKTDKFYPAGYNVRFDLDFLQAFFKFNGEKYGIGSYFNWKIIDAYPMMHIMDWVGKIELENYKLVTVCEKFRIPIKNAHNALDDIEATRTLIRKLFK